MYKFREYNKNDIKSFNTQKEFLDYLDNICKNRGLELPHQSDSGKSYQREELYRIGTS